MMTGRINKQTREETAVQSAVLLAYGSLIFFLQRTGLLDRYVDPDAGRLYLFAALFLFLLALAAAGKEPEPGSKKTKAAYILLALPIILVLIFPAKDFGSSLVSIKGIRLVSYGESQPLPKEQFTASMNQSPQEKITLDDSNFLRYVGEIERHPSAYYGRPIALEGFVCYPSGVDRGEMVAARIVFSHCAADVQALGLVVDLGGLEPPPPDTWVRVEGLIAGREKVLVVRNVVVNVLPKPEKSYVYP
jgi:putative membrane protein